jgi:hypothetical protein|tara:strand:- start:466 stop:597 length:132 start_codon:yes stop_codon:yes gene_type:complete
MEDFIATIRNKKKSKISLKDGVYTLRATLALKKSLNQSQKIIL